MSKKKSPPPLFSENISTFLNSIAQAIKDYEWNTEQLEKAEIVDSTYKREKNNMISETKRIKKSLGESC